MIYDVISYTSDKPALIEWLNNYQSAFSSMIYLDDDGPKLALPKVPIEGMGDHTVTLLRVDESGLAAIQAAPVEILSVVEMGEDPYAPLTQDGWDKIALCIDQTPQEIRINGELVGEYVAPLTFGVFA